ncbi:E3 ubiquitin-protein ligase synoviolin [Sparganum proliferum]
MIAKFICWLFFGTLQRSEVDNILSRAWYTFFDICLVFAFFQDELNTKFMFLFTIILFVKTFHWLLEERIENMERTPVITLSFHLRITTFICLLAAIDIFHIAYFYWGTDVRMLSSLAVGAEYYILLFGLFSTIVRYILQTISSLRDSPWDQKAMYMLYADIAVGLFRLSFYLEFAPILWSHHPFPLFMVRPIYLNFRFLRKTVRDLLMSQRAIRLMNTVFQDITVAELAASSDTVCIICREEMNTVAAAAAATPADGEAAQQQQQQQQQRPSGTEVASSIKRLPCSHIFHATCLRSWFQRQQTCPTCRLNVLRGPRQASQQGQRQQQQQQPGRGEQPAAQPRPATTTSQSPLDSASSANAAAADSSRPAFPATAGVGFTPSFFPAWPSMPNPASAHPGQMPCSFPSPFVAPPIIIPGTVPFPCLSPLMPTPPTDLAQPPDEARLRASVEARVALLQQVQTLLDAAVLQMNAYLAVVSHPSLVLPSSNPPRSTSTLVPPSAVDPSKEKSPAKVECATEEEVSTATKTQPVNPDLAGDDLDVLRKHRLEKLSPKHPADEPTVSPEIKDTANESEKPPGDLPKTN